MKGLENHSIPTDTSKPCIKHLVIPGGGVAGFAYYGILRNSNQEGYWNIDNIETIYSTSAGAMLAVLIALKYDWEICDDYLIKRPWHNVFKFDVQMIFASLQKKGIFDIKVLEDVFAPLFNGKDISIDITMKEFFDLTNIEIHIYATEINTFENVDFSYKTYPDIRVIDAVYASSALPIVFSPIIINDKCYCDGAFFSNYPINNCLNDGINRTEVFGIQNEYSVNDNKCIDNNSTLFDYIMNIMNKTIEHVFSNKKHDDIAMEITIISPRISIYNIFNTVSSMEERIKLINYGSESFAKYIEERA
uniref:PNPLA domain-containing protein n=1 Tax=viral metagenome TaxID=1070528 RepID=A0A6C0DML3_9ZZZZ